MLRDFDPLIAAHAYQSFEPAVPTTTEAFVTAVIGFFLGGGLIHVAALPFRRRLEREPVRSLPPVKRPALEEEEIARMQALLLRQRINRFALPPPVARVAERERS